MFLLDTNVLSELNKGHRGHPGVLHWIANIPEESLFLSALTLGEIRKGIAKLKDARKAAAIETFYAALRQRFSERILPLDLSIMERWGILVGESESAGMKLPVIDSMIAATALEYNLALVTRNIHDFARLPIALVNPWSD